MLPCGALIVNHGPSADEGRVPSADDGRWTIDDGVHLDLTRAAGLSYHLRAYSPGCHQGLAEHGQTYQEDEGAAGHPEPRSEGRPIDPVGGRVDEQHAQRGEQAKNRVGET